MKMIWHLLKRMAFYFSREKCYLDREAEGIAVFNMCCGLSGGDKSTDYLCYECIDCKYFVEGK